MTQAPSAAPRTTPLNARHRALGARMTTFGGWEMPVQYTGVGDEHRAVRTAAGLFDVSHMGEIEIAGGDALAAVQRITSNDAARLDVGQAQYSALTTPAGTPIDDLLVYRLAPEHFLLVVNAANTRKARDWITSALEGAGDAVVVDTSRRYALLALQGPRSQEILQALTAVELEALRYYTFASGEVAGVRATISRTGYTGEDGFELFVAPQAAEAVWTALLQAGAPAGLRPAGLGARDTLRLEASMRLHGQDMDETTTLLEAGLGWIVAWDKGEFTGREALAAQRAAGIERRLVGFEMLDPGIARAGYDVYADGERVGRVTSGTWAPSLGKAIGMAYVRAATSAVDTGIAVEIRGRRAQARIVRMPFYRRARS
ncbi:MAG: glycine cleavage system aminomethyltransferase GcvT [Acidobacteria bacterium]|nr:glycine cleavage system aminomethyltransferase GcvT [Acidobacteriota bacterium]